MDSKHEAYLNLVIVEQMKFDDIPKHLDIDRKTVSLWYEELKVEREKWANLFTLWKKKFRTASFHDFKIWHENTPKKCCYCGIDEQQIEKLFESGLIAKSGRGSKLEIERLQHDLAYDDLNNLCFACYWCNNAKTDTFSAEEFKPIGKEIAKIWQKRLSLV